MPLSSRTSITLAALLTLLVMQGEAYSISAVFIFVFSGVFFFWGFPNPCG